MAEAYQDTRSAGDPHKREANARGSNDQQGPECVGGQRRRVQGWGGQSALPLADRIYLLERHAL